MAGSEVMKRTRQPRRFRLEVLVDVCHEWEQNTPVAYNQHLVPSQPGVRNDGKWQRRHGGEEVKAIADARGCYLAETEHTGESRSVVIAGTVLHVVLYISPHALALP